MNLNMKLRARTLTGQWITGAGWKREPRGGFSLFDAEARRLIRIERETVGRFTGANDKNGRPIYEGDRVSIREEGGPVRWIVRFGIRQTIRGQLRAGFFLELESGQLRPYFWKPTERDWAPWDLAEVIGNIYDGRADRDGGGKRLQTDKRRAGDHGAIGEKEKEGGRQSAETAE